MVFGTATLAAMLLATSVAFAQDEIEDIGPAVDTSAPDTTQNTAQSTDSSESTTDEIGPAVATSASGNEIMRSTTGNRVMDAIQLGRTQITGNQELPTVMYIVPWQKADPGDLMGRPVNTLLDEVLAPIDREEFVRQVDYYDDLYSNKQE
jgi:hypothetical protein